MTDPSTSSSQACELALERITRRRYERFWYARRPSAAMSELSASGAKLDTSVMYSVAPQFGVAPVMAQGFADAEDRAVALIEQTVRVGVEKVYDRDRRGYRLRRRLSQRAWKAFTLVVAVGVLLGIDLALGLVLLGLGVSHGLDYGVVLVVSTFAGAVLGFEVHERLTRSDDDDDPWPPREVRRFSVPADPIAGRPISLN